MHCYPSTKTSIKKTKKKKKGEKKTNNLKPVILLSTVRKNFAICVIERISGKFERSYIKRSSSLPKGKKHNQTGSVCEIPDRKSNYI